MTRDKRPQTPIELLVLAALLAVAFAMGIYAFDTMMREDARRMCRNDGGTLTAEQTQDVCRQAGVIE